jgi:DNA-directed RNA polymerase specialized sigma24 family protein
MHGLDYEAIAESLGCSPESARANVFQAVRKIREGLDGRGLLPGGPLQ